MISFNNRFHGHNSLSYVYKNGKAVRSHSIILKSINNPHRKHTRVAVVISKKVLKSAVRRNRIRRRIYEYMRTKVPFINGVYDIAVIVTSSELINLTHQDMVSQIDQLLEQSEIK